jgi:metallo-beta-lactamase class B
MKSSIFFLSLCLLHLTVFCQTKQEVVKISGDLELVKITPNACIHVSYADVSGYGRVAANGLIFINNKEAFLFDTPWNDSLTKDLVTYLKKSMGIRIVGFIPNHWHSDCMGGLKYLQSIGIESYANQKTIDIARSHNLPLPAHGFKDSLRLFLEDKEIDCYFNGAAHSMDNVVVWIPSEKILFPGCMVKSMNSTDLGNTADGDKTTYPKTIYWLLKKFPMAKIVIPGHGKPGGIDLILHTKELAEK